MSPNASVTAISKRLPPAACPFRGKPSLGYWVTVAINSHLLDLSLTELEALHVGRQVAGGKAVDNLSQAAHSVGQDRRGLAASKVPGCWLLQVMQFIRSHMLYEDFRTYHRYDKPIVLVEISN